MTTIAAPATCSRCSRPTRRNRHTDGLCGKCRANLGAVRRAREWRAERRLTRRAVSNHVVTPSEESDPEREDWIRLYAGRAARSLPLFAEGEFRFRKAKGA